MRRCAVAFAAVLLLGTAVAYADTLSPSDTTGQYACGLLSADEVGKALGTQVTPQPKGGSAPTALEQGFNTCEYDAATGGTGRYVLQVRVETATNPAAAKSLSGFARRPPTGPSKVSVGDEGMLLGSAALEILRGNQVISMQVGTQPSAGSTDTSKALVGLGKTLVSRLGTSASAPKPCTVAASTKSSSGGHHATLSDLAAQYNGTWKGNWSDQTFGADGTIDATLKIDPKSGTATVTINKSTGFLGKGSLVGPATISGIKVSTFQDGKPVTVSGSGLGRVVAATDPSRLLLAVTVSSIAHNKSVKCVDMSGDYDPSGSELDASYTVTFTNGKQSTGIIQWMH